MAVDCHLITDTGFDRPLIYLERSNVIIVLVDKRLWEISSGINTYELLQLLIKNRIGLN